MQNGRVMFMVFLLVPGLVMLTVGIVSGLRSMRFLQSAKRVEGIVTGNKLDTDAETASSYYPEIEFQTADGKRHQLVGRISAAPPKFKVGERLTIAYAENDPGGAKILNFPELFSFPAMFCILGLIFSLAAFFWCPMC